MTFSELWSNHQWRSSRVENEKRDRQSSSASSSAGDLVNSANDDQFRSPRIFRSAQYEEEWKIYSDILDRTNITRHTRWLDMRGNHGKLSLGIFDGFFSFESIRYLHGCSSRFNEEFLSVKTFFPFLVQRGILSLEESILIKDIDIPGRIKRPFEQTMETPIRLSVWICVRDPVLDVRLVLWHLSAR